MNLGQTLFEYRSYTPLPFVLVMMYFAQPTIVSMVIGMMIVFAGEFFRLWGVSIAGSETRTTGPVGGTFLITTGPFAYVRNPLYVGNMLIYTGFGVMSLALFPWLTMMALGFFLFQYNMIVQNEERYLAERFRDEYENYRRCVPKFFPSWKRYHGGKNEQPALEWKRGLDSEKRTLQAIVLLTVVLVIRWMVG
jgi:protein-S-isoprenylcysteine O-methyltransferase Ste14